MAWLSANLMDIITYVKCVSDLEHLEHREQKIFLGRAEQKMESPGKNERYGFRLQDEPSGDQKKRQHGF